MKIVKFTAVVAATLMIGSFSSFSQDREQVPVISSGIGPVTGISVTDAGIDAKAKDFIRKNYPSLAIVGAHEELPARITEIKLSDGTEIEFDKKGDLVEIDAPDDGVLPLKVLKNVVPRETFRHLTKEGFVNRVESVSLTGKGYTIDVEDPAVDEIIYGADGLFVAVINED